MDRVIVSTYFLEGLKRALSGKSINQYIEKSKDEDMIIKDVKYIVKGLKNSNEKKIILLAIDNLEQQKKG